MEKYQMSDNFPFPPCTVVTENLKVSQGKPPACSCARNNSVLLTLSVCFQSPGREQHGLQV